MADEQFPAVTAETKRLTELCNCPYCGGDLKTHIGALWSARLRASPKRNRANNRFVRMDPEERVAEAKRAANTRWIKYRAARHGSIAAPVPQQEKPHSVIASLDAIDSLLKGSLE